MRRFLVLFAIISAALLGASDRARPQRAGQSDAPPTEAERNALLDRVFANQHSDDDALPLFQRVERRQFHGRDAEPNSVEDKTVRIVPTGIGSARIALEDHGHPADPSAVRAQMALVEHQLEAA